jgi:hypothetical protein
MTQFIDDYAVVFEERFTDIGMMEGFSARWHVQSDATHITDTVLFETVQTQVVPEDMKDTLRSKIEEAVWEGLKVGYFVGKRLLESNKVGSDG